MHQWGFGRRCTRTHIACEHPTSCAQSSGPGIAFKASPFDMKRKRAFVWRAAGDLVHHATVCHHCITCAKANALCRPDGGMPDV
mmetsp:Transcript_103901/g.270538  ORF Transcript_103901/g.270538 Transcript_103901/m.270538 type:complete len:84 (+) Transcript_103901:934-1185(+)